MEERKDNAEVGRQKGNTDKAKMMAEAEKELVVEDLLGEAELVGVEKWMAKRDLVVKCPMMDTFRQLQLSGI